LLEKSFRDDDDIEAVSINYIVAPLGIAPDWSQRRSLYMPLVDGETRRVSLKLPLSIPDPSKGTTSRFSLHYYFEIFRAGDQTFSSTYAEDVETGGEASARISDRKNRKGGGAYEASNPREMRKG
jgi:hypothetical protein